MPEEPVITTVDFDRLLEAASDRIHEETAILRQDNERLAALLAEQQALSHQLQQTLHDARKKRSLIDSEIRKLLAARS